MSETTKRDYRSYTDNTTYFAAYDRYQERYRQEPRESDKTTVALLRDRLNPQVSEPAILDSCRRSTGCCGSAAI